MHYFRNFLEPGEDPLFKPFTQKEFDLLKSINQNEVLAISGTHIAYPTSEPEEEGRSAEVPIGMALGLLKRILTEKNGRFFPKDQFSEYLKLRYGNESEKSSQEERERSKTKAYYLKNKMYHTLLWSSLADSQS